MDTHLPAELHGDEIERRLMEKAVAEARADLSPGSPHSEQRIIMLRMIEELDQEINSLLAE